MHVLKTIVFKKATDFRCLSFHVAIFAKHFAQDRILGCTNMLVLNLKRSQLFERFMFFTSKTSSGEKLQVRFEFVWNVFVLNQAASRPKYREVAWMLSEKLYFCTTCCFIIFYSLAQLLYCLLLLFLGEFYSSKFLRQHSLNVEQSSKN